MSRYQLRASAGGNESQDWAQMLLTMYMRWASRNSYRVLIHDRIMPPWASLAWAGIVRVELEIDCPPELLAGEVGVHRLVRTSPFDPESRRHTSFAEFSGEGFAHMCFPSQVQVRRYTLTPYHLVKDLRTQQEVKDVNAVMGGHIEPFIEAWSKFVKEQEPNERII
jgi:protein subunit release factor B